MLMVWSERRTLNQRVQSSSLKRATRRLPTLVALTTLAIRRLRFVPPLSGLNYRSTIAGARDLAVEDRVHFVGHFLHHRWHDAAVGIGRKRDRTVT